MLLRPLTRGYGLSCRLVSGHSQRMCREIKQNLKISLQSIRSVRFKLETCWTCYCYYHDHLMLITLAWLWVVYIVLYHSCEQVAEETSMTEWLNTAQPADNHFLYRHCVGGQIQVTILLPLRPFLSYTGSCLVCTLSLSFTISNCLAWCKATITHRTKCILWKESKHKFPFQNKCKFTRTTSTFKTVKIQTTWISQWRWHIKHLSGSNVPGSTGLVAM
jgi:hypothetical protein